MTIDTQTGNAAEWDQAARIPLTRGLFALADAADAESLNEHLWYVGRTTGSCWYAYRRLPQTEQFPHGRRQSMHHFLTGWSLVDHRNGNGLDNRRSNLRPATSTQNSANKRKTRGSSRYKGVTWNKNAKRWQASIQVNRKRRHLGYFLAEEPAARAYDAAARLTFGAFAALNFPTAGERSALDWATGPAGPPLKTPQDPGARRLPLKKAERCAKGHPFDEGNTSWPPNGRWRRCRTCHAQRARDARQRSRPSPEVLALRAERHRAGLTQLRLGDEMGVSVYVVETWELGYVKPGPEQLAAYEAALRRITAA